MRHQGLGTQRRYGVFTPEGRHASFGAQSESLPQTFAHAFSSASQKSDLHVVLSVQLTPASRSEFLVPEKQKRK